MADLIFDQNMETLLHIPEQAEQLYLSVSDDLSIYSEAPIGADYREKISTMLSLSGKWFALAQEKLQTELGERGRLMAVYLLSEPSDEDFIFGLLFRVEADIEHGRGMKLGLNSLEILDYGLGETAFC